MKTLTSIIFFPMLFLTLSVQAQLAETKAIKKVITTFSEAGDNHDPVVLDDCLDDHYRVVMNRLFGSKEVGIMPKSVYLEKIESKEFGGDTREVSFDKIVINGTTALAKVHFKGKEMQVSSLITLVKNENDVWKLVSDTPIIL